MYIKNIEDFESIKPLTVLYPEEVQSKVVQIMEAWKRFCERPLKVKSRFNFTEGSGGQGDAGYEFREDTSETHDRKETFHLTPAEMNSLISLVWDDVDKEDGLGFVGENALLQLCLRGFIERFAHAVQIEFSLPEDFAARVLANRLHWTFRFLHYLPGSKKGVIAVPHCDKSCFTLHLGEDMPGLEYLDQDMCWRPMDMNEKRTVIIPGLQMQYLSKGRIKAVCHRVISSTASRISGRYSAVCFVSLGDTPVYNKKAVGRTQDFQSGFNYTMPFSEFSKLFV